MIVDMIVFFAFVACVLFVGMFKSKGENTSGDQGAEDYFLAGRGLSWWLIGFSLIAANISAEQFVGMSGQGAGPFGISCASWEWIAAITLVVVAFAFLPYFLKTGITTIPEFLEVRYSHWARTLMTVSMMGILIGASLIGVTYAGGLVMEEFVNQIFGANLSLAACCWIMGAMAGVYVLFGGLKACAWADLVQGSALILGGAVIAYFALDQLGSVEMATNAAGATVPLADMGGAIERFQALNMDKMIMGRPASDPDMPWTILLMGIWIPNFYYWGLNQYITQRILGSGSLAEGQKGLVLAAGLKLLIPFIIVIPGIIAYNLFSDDMATNAAKPAEVEKKIVTSVIGDAKHKNTYITVTPAVWAKMTAEHQAKVGTHNTAVLATAKIDQAAVAKDNDKLTKALTDKNIKSIAYKPKYDSALGLLITKLIPHNKGIMGFVIAALLGAIVSSLAAVLNATSTLFTMDIYGRYIAPQSKPATLVFVGRVVILLLVVIGCVAAPMITSDSIFGFIQEVQCYVSPGVLAVFIFGLINRRASRTVGLVGLLVTPALYAVTRYSMPDLHFLNAASYTLIASLVIMTVYGMIFRMKDPVVFESKTTLDMTMSKGALICGLVVSALTIALYVIFW